MRSNIVGFNVQATRGAQAKAKELGVEIFSSDVIFHVFDEVQRIVSDKLPATYTPQLLGAVQVQKLFPMGLTKLAVRRMCEDVSHHYDRPVTFTGEPIVLGSRVTEGEIIKYVHSDREKGLSESRWRVMREGKPVIEGLQCISLKHFKEEVPRMPKGKECGLMISNTTDVAVGDIVECYQDKKTPRKFDDRIARGYGSEQPDWAAGAEMAQRARQLEADAASGAAATRQAAYANIAVGAEVRENSEVSAEAARAMAGRSGAAMSPGKGSGLAHRRSAAAAQ
jgi:hypothetical protein